MKEVSSNLKKKAKQKEIYQKIIKFLNRLKEINDIQQKIYRVQELSTTGKEVAEIQ